MNASGNTIQVLIVDDSALVRKVMSEILSSDSLIEVVGTAPDAQIATRQIRKLNPDVITLDIQMPGMNGLDYLERLMKSQPRPVVMVSSLTQKGAPEALKALELGAVEVIGKPDTTVREGMEEISIQIVDAVKAAAQAKLKKNTDIFLKAPEKLTADVIIPKNPPKHLSHSIEPIIAIGASTGGTEALMTLLTQLPESMPGIVMVQHMPGSFTKSFAQRLDHHCRLTVKEAESGERIRPGTAYLAPGDQHLLLKNQDKGYCVELIDGPLVCRHRPSVDALFRSTAQVARHHATGVILTGMGDDGAQGMLEMKEAGSFNIAQDEASSVVYGLPKMALSKGGVDEVHSLNEIPHVLVKHSH
ncbi:MAG: chemotaxis response regulator protein-glutamate methylesterase [SAR324 cluster bacterium]|nr:chemotaxis response regulator protein-glutamate methylesterase [SAR324 cluster bacterium]